MNIGFAQLDNSLVLQSIKFFVSIIVDKNDHIYI